MAKRKHKDTDQMNDSMTVDTADDTLMATTSDTTEGGENDSTLTMLIQGTTFRIPARYVEGTPLTSGQAAALNKAMADSIRNTFNRKIANALGEGGVLDSAQVTSYQAEITAKAEEYSFDHVVRTRSPRIVDPVERRLRKMAEQAVIVLINKKGYTRAQLSTENFNTLVESVITSQPSLREDAARAVAAESAIAQSVIASMGQTVDEAVNG